MPTTSKNNRKENMDKFLGFFQNSWNSMISWSNPVTNGIAGLLTGLNNGKRVSSPTFMFKGGPWRVSAENPVLLYNDMKDFEGSTISTEMASGTIAIAASNTQRVTAWSNIGTVVSGIQSADNESEVHFMQHSQLCYFQSTAPFAITPFVVLLENGETVTSSDVNTSNIETAINTSVSGTRHIFYGPQIQSKVALDAGNKFIAQLYLDLTVLSNLYAKHLSRFQFEERNPLVMIVGLCTTGIASQSITYQSVGSKSYYLKAREMVL